MKKKICYMFEKYNVFFKNFNFKKLDFDWKFISLNLIPVWKLTIYSD